MTIVNKKLDLEPSGLGIGSKTNKEYEKPVLMAYGDVRDITLGPTFGGGESGCSGALYKFGPGGPGPCP